MANEKLFQVGVKALIQNNSGKILLLHAPGWAKNNTLPHWDIPGGRIQEGQTIEEALKREVEEEIGVKDIISSEFFTAVVSKHQIPLDDKTLGLILMIYRVQIPKDSKLVLSDEHTGYEWVDEQGASKRLSNKYPPEFTKKIL